jgi:hypothetical protein
VAAVATGRSEGGHDRWGRGGGRCDDGEVAECEGAVGGAGGCLGGAGAVLAEAWYVLPYRHHLRETLSMTAYDGGLLAWTLRAQKDVG